MLETKYVSDNYQMLVAVLAISMINIHLHLSVEHQHSKDVTNMEIQLPTLSHQHQDFTNTTVTKTYLSPNWVRIGFWIWSCTWILRFLLFSGHSEINEHILPLCDSFQTIWRVGWLNVLSKLDRAHFLQKFPWLFRIENIKISWKFWVKNYVFMILHEIFRVCWLAYNRF